MKEKEINEQMQNFEPKEPSQTRQPEQMLPQPAKKVRRVGTFTMGCVMILAGATILCSGILGWDNLMLIAKLSPIVLILLGVEVLVASFAQKAKLKYDVFGVILSSLVVCFVAAVSLGYQWFFVQMPQAEKTERLAKAYISDKLYASVNKEGIKNMTINLSRPMGQWEIQNVQQAIQNSDIFLNINLQPEYSQPSKLAEKAVEINEVIKQQLSGISLDFLYVSYTAENQETQGNISLELTGRYSFDQSTVQLEQQIQTQEHRYDIQDCVEEYETQLQKYRNEIDELTHQLETERVEHEIQLEELRNQNNPA